MTISGIFTGIVCTFCFLLIVFTFYGKYELPKVSTIIVSIICVIFIWAGLIFYYSNTASGRRAVVDQYSELSNGLERTINVYTANGDLIATYTGKFDLEDNAGGYVIFDWEGKRYTYYNCFVESIANIK